MDTSGAMQVDADDPDAFNHCFAEVNGIRTHYIHEGQGPLVILLHGFPYRWTCGGARSWLSPSLSQRGSRHG